MRTITLAAVCAATLGWEGVSSSAQSPMQPLGCLHGASETAGQRSRRELALRTVDAINKAEHPVQPSTQPRTYKPLAQLPNPPLAPDGFRLQFHTDGATYSVSLKDTLDPCEYAIFSDQDGSIYDGAPRPGVRVRPLDSR